MDQRHRDLFGRRGVPAHPVSPDPRGGITRSISPLGLADQGGCPGPSGLRILIGSSGERTGSGGWEIPEVHS